MNRRDSFPMSVAMIGRERQRGYLMVVSMLIILLITVMSISMAKSFFQEEGMASNVREKSRSFAAAQAGLRYAEWIATRNGLVQGGNCVTSGVLATTSICNAAPISSASYGGAPLQAYWVVPAFPAATAPAPTTTPTLDSYYALPGVYIWWEGSNAGAAVYQITAFGYGGTSDSMSEVQSTLNVTCAARSPVISVNPCE